MAKNFYTETICHDKRFGSPQTIKDTALLEPGTRAAVVKLLALAKKAGHDLRLGETFRSQARQTHVFNAGASKLRMVGCHGYGLAADLMLFVNGKYEGRGEAYAFLRDLCKQCGLISGIDWGDPTRPHKFIDAGHVQRIPVWRQSSVFTGRWYPPIDYDPYRDHEARGGEALV